MIRVCANGSGRGCYFRSLLSKQDRVVMLVIDTEGFRD